MVEHVAATTSNVMLTLANYLEEAQRLFKNMLIMYEAVVYLPQTGDTDLPEWPAQVVARSAGNEKTYRHLMSQKAFTDIFVHAEEFWSLNDVFKRIVPAIMTSREQEEALRQRLYDKLSDVPDTPLLSAKNPAEAANPRSRELSMRFPSARHMAVDHYCSPFWRSDIAFAELVRSRFKFGGSMLLGEHRTVVEALNLLGASDQAFPRELGGSLKLHAPALLDKLETPDFGSMPWDDILELRKERYIGHFRTKMGEIMRMTRTTDAREIELSGTVENAL